MSPHPILPQSAITEYRLFPVENGCMKFLYYRKRIPHKILGINFYWMDNIFLPNILDYPAHKGSPDNWITPANTDIPEFIQKWPDAEKYMDWYNNYSPNLW